MRAPDKYLANYVTSSGDHAPIGYYGSNKQALAYIVRQVAAGNCLKGASARWTVTDVATGDILLGGKIIK